MRRRNRLQNLNGIEVRIESLSVNGREVVNISPLGADEKRRVLYPFDRAPNAPIELDGVIIWLGAGEWIGRIERRIVSADLNLAVVTVGARLRKNLNAAVAEFVVFRRERIRINANLAN